MSFLSSLLSIAGVFLAQVFYFDGFELSILLYVLGGIVIVYYIRGVTQPM